MFGRVTGVYGRVTGVYGRVTGVYGRVTGVRIIVPKWRFLRMGGIWWVTGGRDRKSTRLNFPVTLPYTLVTLR